MSPEHRASGRAPLSTVISVNHIQCGEGIDISDDGMYIYSRRSFLEGTILEINFELGGKHFDLSVKVSHVQPGVGFGVTFMDIEPEALEALHEVVARIRKESC